MAASLPRLKFGQKQVYLPNFQLTLLRTPFLPPTFATFLTPLNLNKLDIKDYLYHAYGVRVLAVRSYVQQQRVRADKPNAKRPGQNRWFRPRSIKKMTIEMTQPFVWPDEPTDFAAWDQKRYNAVEQAQEEFQEERKGYLRHGDDRGDTKQQEFERASKMPAPAYRLSMAEQAKALLEGKERWISGRDVWEDYGDPVEVDLEYDEGERGKEKKKGD
ncbi:MAG: hypothetical protein M1829_003159 [Trizodia sp. TS-e1964]|nr:MAG: hypothetical protein M1829_003159 [Trizodia sp. TS-e1964]